ncbi:MAG: hypothetical protein RJQ14_17255 [Marinoscillum sp.]
MRNDELIKEKESEETLNKIDIIKLYTLTLLILIFLSLLYTG